MTAEEGGKHSCQFSFVVAKLGRNWSEHSKNGLARNGMPFETFHAQFESEWTSVVLYIIYYVCIVYCFIYYVFTFQYVVVTWGLT